MWRAVLTLILLATAAGCERRAASPPEPPRKVVFACTTQPQSTLVNVALAKGYFAEEGLEVQSLMYTFGKAALQALLEKKADFATVAETPVMFGVLKGESFFVIANIEASNRNNAIVARRDAGIASLRDLKGKRVGFTPGTTSEFFLDSLLTAQGLTRQGIVPVGLKPEDMQEAILRRQVDAVCTWNYPLAQINRRLAGNGAIFYDREIYTETFNIAATTEMVEQQPGTVARILRALLKSEAFVAARPGEAQAIVAAATKTDEGLVREVWDAFNYRVRMDQTLLITLEDETRWAMRNHLTDRTAMPDFRKYIHTESLRSVKPEAVNLGK